MDVSALMQVLIMIVYVRHCMVLIMIGPCVRRGPGWYTFAILDRNSAPLLLTNSAAV